MNPENLSAADRAIQTVLSYSDHAYHGRVGIVSRDASVPHIGVKWSPVTTKVEGEVTKVYSITKVGKKTTRTEIGILNQETQEVKQGTRLIGKFRRPGLFPEVVAWMYQQIADVWALDNEFLARWASYAYTQDHRDLKVIMAAFLLVQSRKGEPTLVDGKVAFHDDDFRDVGEAILLLKDERKPTAPGAKKADAKDLNPKLILRVRDVLSLPEVIAINKKLGFGVSPTNKPILGRYEKSVAKWLKYREENPKLFSGLIKSGFRQSVMEMSRRIGYKPETPTFFQTLRWKQQQAKEGHRTIAIGEAVKAADSWEKLTEAQICQKIVQEKPSWKVVVSKVPATIGITRAIMAAAVTCNAMSDKDIVIATPTLEDLGLLEVQDIKRRWEAAMKNATDMRAANIAKNVKTKEVQDKLIEASEDAAKKIVEDAMKDFRVYFMVDISGSMQGAIEGAKVLLTKLLAAFPQDRIHISVFNTSGREVKLRAPNKEGIEASFRGISAGGGTDYGAGVKALQGFRPKDDEDVLFFFVGDEEATPFATAVTQSGLNPRAFAFLKVLPNSGAGAWRQAHYAETTAVRVTAQSLGIPCFMVEPALFDDAYAVPRVLANLIKSTPVTQQAWNAPKAKRESLAEIISKTPLLQKPVWA